jgi:ubiquinone/menaquinone biosynthesis C-methylase UbiE
MSEETWHSVWERKGARAAAQESYSEDDLFAANGYDTPLGIISARGRRQMARKVVEALQARPGRSLLDVGCGSGAMLSLLRETGARLAGVDFSTTLVEIARRSLPDVEILTAEAAKLPFPTGQFDAALSNGVFLYFTDFQYAAAALEEMLRVCGSAGRLFIGDVPDLGKKESCIAARRSAGASLSPAHLYYPQRFFEEFAAGHALRATFADQDIPDYANTSYRFNVVLEPVLPQPKCGRGVE